MSTVHPLEARLGRKPRYDWRNLRLSSFITPDILAAAAATSLKEWGLSSIPDQGDTPHCVGFGWLNFGNAAPVEDDWPNSRGHDIYYKAKEFDGEPGQEDGSSTLSGVKAFMQFGELEGSKYAFASSVEEVKVWVLAKGTVVVGTDWTSDMFTPDASGIVHPTGDVRGGHEYIIVGYDRDADLFKFANSWGPNWGQGGFFYMPAKDFEWLMKNQGDACVTVEAAPSPTPTPTPTPEPVPSQVPQWFIDLLTKLLTVPGLPKWLRSVIQIILASLQ